MPKQNKKFGAWGERLAKEFLQKRKYEILDRNFQKRYGEIDIIAQKEGTLHFVEVKTRKASSTEIFGQPEEAVNLSKQKKMVKTACSYLAEKGFPEDMNWQMDVITVVYEKENKIVKIRLISAAFDESLF